MPEQPSNRGEINAAPRGDGQRRVARILKTFHSTLDKSKTNLIRQSYIMCMCICIRVPDRHKVNGCRVCATSQTWSWNSLQLVSCGVKRQKKNDFFQKINESEMLFLNFNKYYKHIFTLIRSFSKNPLSWNKILYNVSLGFFYIYILFYLSQIINIYH